MSTLSWMILLFGVFVPVGLKLWRGDDLKEVSLGRLMFIFTCASLITWLVFFVIFPQVWYIGAIGAIIFLGLEVYKDSKKPIKPWYGDLLPVDITFKGDREAAQKRAEDLINAELEKMKEKRKDKIRDDDLVEALRNQERKTEAGSFKPKGTSKEFEKSARVAAMQHGFNVQKMQRPKRK